LVIHLGANEGPWWWKGQHISWRGQDFEHHRYVDGLFLATVKDKAGQIKGVDIVEYWWLTKAVERRVGRWSITKRGQNG
jgi:hypothetical protein